MELFPTKYANIFCADELTELVSAIVALPLRAVQVGAMGLRKVLGGGVQRRVFYPIVLLLVDFQATCGATAASVLSGVARGPAGWGERVVFRGKKLSQHMS